MPSPPPCWVARPETPPVSPQPAARPLHSCALLPPPTAPLPPTELEGTSLLQLPLQGPGALRAAIAGPGPVAAVAGAASATPAPGARFCEIRLYLTMSYVCMFKAHCSGWHTSWRQGPRPCQTKADWRSSLRDRARFKSNFDQILQVLGKSAVTQWRARAGQVPVGCGCRGGQLQARGPVAGETFSRGARGKVFWLGPDFPPVEGH